MQEGLVVGDCVRLVIVVVVFHRLLIFVILVILLQQQPSQKSIGGSGNLRAGIASQSINEGRHGQSRRRQSPLGKDEHGVGIGHRSDNVVVAAVVVVVVLLHRHQSRRTVEDEAPPCLGHGIRSGRQSRQSRRSDRGGIVPQQLGQGQVRQVGQGGHLVLPAEIEIGIRTGAEIVATASSRTCTIRSSSSTTTTATAKGISGQLVEGPHSGGGVLLLADPAEQLVEVRVRPCEDGGGRRARRRCACPCCVATAVIVVAAIVATASTRLAAARASCIIIAARRRHGSGNRRRRVGKGREADEAPGSSTSSSFGRHCFFASFFLLFSHLLTRLLATSLAWPTTKW